MIVQLVVEPMDRFAALILSFISVPSIKEDYYKVVEPNKAGFEASLRQQLANLLNTPDTQIQNLRTWPGSIEVT